MKQHNYEQTESLEDLVVNDIEWQEFQLRSILTPTEGVVNIDHLGRLRDHLMNIHWEAKYLKRELNIEQILEATIEDINFIIMGSRP